MFLCYLDEEKQRRSQFLLDFLIFPLLVHVLSDEDQRQRCHVALRGSRGKREEREGSERSSGHTDLPGSITLKWWTQSKDPPGQGRMSADSTEV